MFELIRDYGLILLFFILPIIFVLEPLFFSKLDYHPNDDNYSILKRKKILLLMVLEVIQGLHQKSLIKFYKIGMKK